MQPNPYQSPHANSPGPLSEERAGPSRFAWLGHVALLGILIVMLLGIWFGGTTSHGRGHYKHEHGVFDYYVYESVNGVVTKSHVRPWSLFGSVAASLLFVIIAVGDIRQWLKEQSDRLFE
jgi:di/tricarboxylate transporter